MQSVIKYYPSLCIRILLCFIPISVFYTIFLPLTIKGTALFLLPYHPVIVDNLLIMRNYGFEFVEACIATAAYYLLWCLVMLTKDITIIMRIKMIGTSFVLFLAMNIIRIIMLILLALYSTQEIFDVVHLVFWQLIAGVYVAAVWFFVVRVYKVKSIPMYDDIGYFYKHSFFKKSRNRIRG